MDGEHAPDHHLLLLHLAVAAQLEPSLQLAGGVGRKVEVEQAERAESQQQQPGLHAAAAQSSGTLTEEWVRRVRRVSQLSSGLR